MIEFARGLRFGRRWSSSGAIGVLVAGLILLWAPPVGASPVWSIVPSVDNGVFQDFLSAVSCVSPTTCMAVGMHDGSDGQRLALAESWDGVAWKAVPTPAGSQLSDVSCASANSCKAVGWIQRDGDDVARSVIESWDGARWTGEAHPNRGTGTNVLSGVSCISSSSCTAVGEFNNSIGASVLIEQWNGTTWTAEGNKPIPGVRSLQSVSCVSATSCTAVGIRNDAHGVERTLIESWNGRAWQVVASPNLGASGNVLTHVTCISATSCRAVGAYGDGVDGSKRSQRTLVEAWDGKSWKIERSPNRGTFVSALSGVSCITATSCKAVGHYQQISTGAWRTLVESWNGKTWNIVSSPNPATGTLDGFYGRHGSGLHAVSCFATTGCIAVGFREGLHNDERVDTLVERYA